MRKEVMCKVVSFVENESYYAFIRLPENFATQTQENLTHVELITHARLLMQNYRQKDHNLRKVTHDPCSFCNPCNSHNPPDLTG